MALQHATLNKFTLNMALIKSEEFEKFPYYYKLNCIYSSCSLSKNSLNQILPEPCPYNISRFDG